MLYRHQNNYVLDGEDRVVALNLCRNPKLTRLELPQALADSLQFLHAGESAALCEVIFPESGLPRLQKADFNECALETFQLPVQCPALKWLDLRKNKLTGLPFSGDCPMLEYLDLSENKLGGELRLSGSFDTLLYLYLNENQLEKLDLGPGLRQLETLQLRGNQLASLPVDLPRVDTLNIAKNQLTDLEPVLPLLENGLALLGDENPWERPPAETVKEGREAILNYFAELRRAGEEKSLEAKLILIGEAQAGKTSLRSRLLRPGDPLPSKADRTKGLDIEIEKYSFPIVDGETMRLNLFDFGGQDHYKPLHQFFYSRRALYVLVTKNGDESNDFDFWFDTAQLFGDGSPVLVVNNLFGDVPSQFNRGKFSRFEAILKDPVDTNLLTTSGWPEAKKRIEQLAEALPHVQQFIPKTWANVRRALQALRADNVLSLSEFLRICAKPENGAMNKERALRCSQYLHDIGICLHYQDDETLRKQVIVKNEWATDAVYRVIDDPAIAKEQGLFNWGDLRRIWAGNDYEDLRPELLALMKRFRLCYELPGASGFIAPTLLPTKPPAGYAWHPDRDLQIFVEYDFMPSGLMSQLIVLLHAYIAEGKHLVWRDGVVLHWPNARAEATLAKRGGKQTIGIRANGAERRELLTFIDRQLETLHLSFGRGLKVERKIPCNCSKCLNSETPLFFDLSRVEKRRKDGRPDIECDESYEQVPIEALLGSVFSQEKTAPLPMEPAARKPGPARLFVSYAHEDEPFKEAFKTALSVLTKTGKLKIWDDRQLLAGAVFEAEIFEKLHEADIICLLISPDFIQSDFCFSNEMEAALKRLEAGNGRVVPVHIRPVEGWDTLPVGALNAANKDGQPVSLASDKDSAWAAVVGKIRQLVETIS